RDVPRALAALGRAGWREVPAPMPDGLRPYVCAQDLERRSGERIDLHQFLIEYGSTPEIEEGLWRRSHPLQVGSAWTRAPAGAALLLHVCLACLKPGRSVNSRWIADAARILPAGPLDWELFVAEAIRRRTVLALRECLEVLADVLGPAVPAHAREALAR